MKTTERGILRLETHNICQKLKIVWPFSSFEFDSSAISKEILQSLEKRDRTCQLGLLPEQRRSYEALRDLSISGIKMHGSICLWGGRTRMKRARGGEEELYSKRIWVVVKLSLKALRRQFEGMSFR